MSDNMTGAASNIEEARNNVIRAVAVFMVPAPPALIITRHGELMAAFEEYDAAVVRLKVPRGNTAVFVRHAVLAWPHADDMNSIERWEKLAQHITEWVDDRRTLREVRDRNTAEVFRRDGLPLVERDGKVYAVPASPTSKPYDRTAVEIRASPGTSDSDVTL